MGRSVVKTDIPWGGVLAYTRGQTIDSDLVEQHGWQDYVAGENTKEGREIKAEITGRDISDFEPESIPKSSSRASAKNEQEG